MKKLLCIGSIIFFLLSLVSPGCKSGAPANVEDDTINWRPHYHLAVTDFHGAPDYESKFAAASHVFVAYDFYPDSIPRYHTYCCFQRDSWIKKEKADARVLKHEQVHFDIGEIFARKLQLVLDHNDTAEDVRHKLFDQVIQEELQFDRKYDSETRHSRDSVKQEEWNNYIAKLLKGAQNNDSLSAFPHF